MRYCPTCGAELSEKDSFCTRCGSVLDKTEASNNKAKPISVLSIVSTAMGAIGIALAWFIPIFFGYGLGIAGLVCAIVSIYKHPGEGAAKAGLLLSIASIACAILNSIIVIAILA